MVARIDLWFAVMAWLMVPVMGFAAEPPLRLAVATSGLEYGMPVTVDLSVSGLQPDLNTLDLSGLDRDFIVETLDNVERDAETGRQRWRIRLYPRRPGELWIPSLIFHGKKTDPVKLSVSPAADSRNNA